MVAEGVNASLNLVGCVVVPVYQILSCLIHGVHPALVLQQLSLEGLVLLKLGLEVCGVTVALVRGSLELLTDPAFSLQVSRKK